MDRPPPARPTRAPQMSGPARTPWWFYVEDAVNVLAIGVLWFTVLRVRGPAVRAVQIVTLVVLVAIMIARLCRFWRARRKAEEDARKL